ncbi:hypothetical protein [Allokutzneria oryzae]|uniref:DUF2029 domain-containing protein n=1 Tax=Allokutzneria oryzae TaxID=1378989 RepID=A0ABV6A6G0_9PSEU
MNRGARPLTWIPPLTAALALVAYALLRNIPGLHDFSQPVPPSRQESGLWWAVLNLDVFGGTEDSYVHPLEWSYLGLAALVFAVAAVCHWWTRRGSAWLWPLGFYLFLVVVTAVKALSYNDIAVAMGFVVAGVLLVCVGLYLYRRNQLWGLVGVLGMSVVAVTLRPIDGFMLVLFAVLTAYAVVERSALLALTGAVYLVVAWWPQWTLDYQAGFQVLTAEQFEQLDVFWLSARVYIGPVSVLLLGTVAVVVSGVLARRRGAPEPSQ